MSRFEPAVEFTLASEGVFSDHPYDNGGATKYGITHGTLKTYQRKTGRLAGRHIRDLTVGEATSIYRELYWRYDGVQSQMLATKLFDIGVNFGVTVAVQIAQHALNFIALGPQDKVEVDGLWGPKTLRAINNAPPLRLFKAIVLFQAKGYVDIVMHRPTQLEFVDGWITRAGKRPR